MTETTPNIFPALRYRDANAAIEWLKANNLALILLDLSLPDSQGLDTLIRVRECSPNIPVIVLSNYGDPELRRLGLQLGAFEFLVKVDTTPSTLAVRTREFFQTNIASRNGNRPKAPADS